MVDNNAYQCNVIKIDKYTIYLLYINSHIKKRNNKNIYNNI